MPNLIVNLKKNYLLELIELETLKLLIKKSILTKKTQTVYGMNLENVCQNIKKKSQFLQGLKNKAQTT